MTQKTTEVGECGGLQKTEVARNGLSVWCVNAFIIGVLIDEISAYAGMGMRALGFATRGVETIDVF